jgi:hypothetical protein
MDTARFSYSMLSKIEHSKIRRSHLKIRIPFDGNAAAAQWLADLFVRNGIRPGDNTVDLQLIRVDLYTRDIQKGLLGDFDDRVCDFEANLIPRFGPMNGVATNLQARVALAHSYSQLRPGQKVSFGPEDIRVCEVALAKALNDASANGSR